MAQSNPVPSTDLPKDVEEILRPNPFIEQLAFNNYVLTEVCRSVYGKIPLFQLRNYVADQRTGWWDIQSKHLRFSAKYERITSGETVDGEKMNCFTYGTENEGTGMKDVDSHRIQKTIDYIDRFRTNIKDHTDFFIYGFFFSRKQHVSWRGRKIYPQPVTSRNIYTTLTYYKN